MGFEIIKKETRVTRMITWFAGIQSYITDLLPGGKTRTKFEAIAIEMEHQDFTWFQSIKKGIAVAVYNAFGFTLRPAVRASGYVTFSGASADDIIIAAGSKVTVPATATSAEKIYTVTTATTLQAGQASVSVPVSCTVAGTIGNTGEETIKQATTPITGITGVLNNAAFVNGIDRETEDQRKTRFQNFIASLSKATDAAVRYGATTAQLLDADGNVAEQVVDAVVVGPPTTAAGYFNVYIWNGFGAASADLVAKTQEIVDGYLDGAGKPVPGYKAAGDVATVISVATVVGNVTLEVTAAIGANAEALETLVVKTVTAYIQGLVVGQSFSLNEMIRRVKNLVGVSDFTVTAYPVAVITKAQVLIPGAVTVNVT
jgi:uncharacterized phage protein gp47/JayE